MKTRNREVNIFSMSALDLFASALGAFILITVVLFPFFPNTGDSQERVAEVKTRLAATQRLLADVEASLNSARQQALEQNAEIQSLRQQLADCQAALQDSSSLLEQLDRSQQELSRSRQELSEAQQTLQECRRALKKTFVLALVSWSTQDDVDLHVVDPSGREFYFGNKRELGSPAVLEEDNTRGPGNEIWLHPEAEPGSYKVYVKYFARRTSSVRVRGAVLHQDGKNDLPETRLTRQGEKPLVATIVVDNEGNVSIR